MSESRVVLVLRVIVAAIVLAYVLLMAYAELCPVARRGAGVVPRGVARGL